MASLSSAGSPGGALEYTLQFVRNFIFFQRLKIPEKRLLFFGQMGWGAHQHLDDLVAPAVVSQRRDTLPPETEDLPGLGPRRDLQLFFAIQGGDGNRVTQCGLYKGNGDIANHIVAVALEKIMGTDM